MSANIFVTKLTTKEQKLLSRVVSYYQHTLTEDSRGIEHLKQEYGVTVAGSV